jgi:hypothetical protein
MPVGIIVNAATADAECAASGAGSPDLSQVGGDYQNGCAAYEVTTGVGEPYYRSLVRQLPGVQRVQLPAGSNPSVVQKGPQEYFVTLSLGEHQTLQLSPGMGNCQQAPSAAVSPNAFSFVYTSRNINVATVSNAGLITPVGRGECVILIGSVRGVNAPFVGATPPAGNTGCEVYCELAVRVLP